MNNELPITHRVGMILLNSQILHCLRASNDEPVLDDCNPPIALDQVHADVQIRDKDEAFLYGQERMFLVGVSRSGY